MNLKQKAHLTLLAGTLCAFGAGVAISEYRNDPGQYDSHYHLHSSELHTHSESELETIVTHRTTHRINAASGYGGPLALGTWGLIAFGFGMYAVRKHSKEN